MERLNLKFAAVAYHLWHAEASRASSREIKEILTRTLLTAATRCARGIDRHLGLPLASLFWGAGPLRAC